MAAPAAAAAINRLGGTVKAKFFEAQGFAYALGRLEESGDGPGHDPRLFGAYYRDYRLFVDENAKLSDVYKKFDRLTVRS